MPARIPLLLDVDTGIDDALALLYACASPEVELVGVTCIGGNVGARQVADNTRAVLELAGRGDVPVFLGREQPLVKRLATAEETHGPGGLGYAELPESARPLENAEAADGILALAKARPGEIHLVTLGPLTNLAVALEREPRLPHLLADWTLMGGAYRTPGNTTPTSEWNIHVDPHAAKALFAGWSGGPDRRLPLALGLDVTEQVRILPGHLRHLAVLAGAQPLEAEELARGPADPIGSVAANPILRFVVDALRFYFEFHEQFDGFYGAVIHDPFAVAASLDKSLVRTQAAYVDVETGRNLAHGMTVTDWRNLSGRTPNVDVAVACEPDRFLDRFLDRVGGLAAAPPVVAR